MHAQQTLLSLPSPHRTHAHEPERKKRHKARPQDRQPRRRAERKDKDFDRRANAEAWRIPPATPEETTFRHGHWQQRRDRVRNALTRSGANSFALDRWDNCGSECRVEYSKELQQHRLRANYCKSRHCEPCARAKAGLIARNLRSALEDAKKNQHRFLTLTLKHTDAPLAKQIERLYTSFKKLRASKCWKKSQDGGAMLLEVKHNGRHWHPHLHVISQGRYLRKEDLSAAWLKATGDSMIVDVRAIGSEKDVVHYVCKYITKGTTPAIWQSDDLAGEYLLATKGVRACGTYGTWRGFKLLAHPKTADDWQPVASLTEIWNAARGGERWALDALDNVRPSNELLELE